MPPFPLPDPELRDDLLRLRPPREADVPALVRACRDPDIRRFTPVAWPYEERHARDWVAGATERRVSGTAMNLVIAGTGDEGLLGAAMVIRPDWDQRVCEVGYWVAPWARGRGVAMRAARLLARWALLDLGMARVTCNVDVDNAASLRAAQTAGFVREGVLRSASEIRGRRCDLVVLSLLPGDLEAAG